MLAIFRADLASLRTNMIAAVVAMGLVIVPPMYAWLTTLGFWDPYTNTGSIAVAVANEDAGYESDLLSMRIDAGAEIVSALHENDRFDWEFMGKEEAIESVRAGKSYAAFVIPAGFSRDLLTACSSGGTRPTIKYYSNQKINAIAIHVTSEGATDLQAQIDDSFTETVARIALDATKELADLYDGDGISAYAAALSEQLSSILEQLDGSIAQARSFSDLMSVARDLMEASTSILADTSRIAEDGNALLDDARSGLDAAIGGLEGMTADIDAALGAARSSLDGIEAAVDAAFSSFEGVPGDAEALLGDLAQDVDDSISAYRSLRTTLAGMGVAQATLDEVDAAISALERLSSSLDQARTSIGSTASEIASAKQSVQESLDAAEASIGSVSTGLEDELEAQASTLAADLSSIRDDAERIGGTLVAASGPISQSASDLMGSLQDAEDSVERTTTTLEAARTQLQGAHERLEEALATGDLDEVRRIIGNDPDSVAAFLSAPTELVKHPVFEVATNGDSMSPFYSSLSLWIGAVFLVALTSVSVPRKRREALADPKPWELYLGRYGIFATIALAQAIVLCLGNVFVVGVQCERFWPYLLACCVCAVVFSNIVYTLTVAFGNIGKALAIIMLVMQLAGTGGIMPVQMSAPVFQAIYPWLPFAHSIDAMFGCIAGFAGDQYLLSLLCLLAFLAASLVVGIALGKPLAKANAFVQGKLDETRFL